MVIFNFNVDKQPSAMSRSEPCISLKNFIQRLRNLRSPRAQLSTVAYLQNKVSGFTVLPVLECDEIVMTKEATLGNVRGEKQQPLTPKARTSLEEVAKRWPSPDVVRKLANADLLLVPVQMKDGVRYLDEATVKKAADEGKPYTLVPDVTPAPRAIC